jgi:hypothetical protein
MLPIAALRGVCYSIGSTAHVSYSSGSIYCCVSYNTDSTADVSYSATMLLQC